MDRVSHPLLTRGRACFSLAAMASLRGTGGWNALAPAFAHPADGIRTLMDETGDAVLLAAAVDLAFSGEIETVQVPSFVCHLTSADLPFLGDTLTPSWPPGCESRVGGRTGGLALLATAFCRDPDLVSAVAQQLDPADQKPLCRMARLSAVRCAPGEPSRCRRNLRRLLRTECNGTDLST